MSHLSAAKAKAFAEKLAKAKAGPAFRARQAEHERAVAEANAGLTAVLAERQKSGKLPTAEDVAQFPDPGESPADALAREILKGMQK